MDRNKEYRPPSATQTHKPEEHLSTAKLARGLADAAEHGAFVAPASAGVSQTDAAQTARLVARAERGTGARDRMYENVHTRIERDKQEAIKAAPVIPPLPSPGGLAQRLKAYTAERQPTPPTAQDRSLDDILATPTRAPRERLRGHSFDL